MNTLKNESSSKWKLCGDDNLVYSQDGEVVICKVCPVDLTDGLYYSGQQTKANATLIAEAPEMLDIIKSINAFGSSLEVHGGFFSLPFATLERIQTLLEKLDSPI